MPGNWVARELPTIDRRACPWMIRRFIAAAAESICVSTGLVLPVAKGAGASPDDGTNRTMLEARLVVYEAVHTWCRCLQRAARHWRPQP